MVGYVCKLEIVLSKFVLRDTEHLDHDFRWYLWNGRAYPRQLAVNMADLEQTWGGGVSLHCQPRSHFGASTARIV